MGNALGSQILPRRTVQGDKAQATHFGCPAGDRVGGIPLPAKGFSRFNAGARYLVRDTRTVTKRHRHVLCNRRHQGSAPWNLREWQDPGKERLQEMRVRRCDRHDIGWSCSAGGNPIGWPPVFILNRRLRCQHRFDRRILLGRARQISRVRLCLTQPVELLDHCVRQIITKAPVIAHRGAHHIKPGGEWLWLLRFVDRAHPAFRIIAKRRVDKEFHVIEHGLTGVCYHLRSLRLGVKIHLLHYVQHQAQQNVHPGTVLASEG